MISRGYKKHVVLALNKPSLGRMTDQSVIYTDGESSARGWIPLPTGLDFALSESNHRIANNLTLLASALGIRAGEIANRDRDLDCEEVSLILGEVSARISTVAWLHRFLSKEPDADRIDLNGHLYELCETLLSALSDPWRMKLVRTGGGECRVETGKIVPLCLLITEVVTNSLKYAHPTGVAGTISVGCRRTTDGALVVEIADDGVGLPEGFDLKVDGGTGAKTIRVLAKQLDARIDFVPRSIGTLFRLAMPPEARAA